MKSFRGVAAGFVASAVVRAGVSRLEVYRDDNYAYAKVVVGPRTLLGLSAKLANDASV